ncbi:MAG: MBL fold metallo-hydrolase [Pyrinomonadaceae bacterium]
MKATVMEIAPDIFRINTFLEKDNLGFSQFLVRDDEPLLFHTGMRYLFPIVHEAVATLIDPVKLRWIGFSHFEADECGSLNEWQTVASNAAAVCSMVGKLVSVDDFAQANPALGMNDGDTLSTGQRRFRFLATPHVPHCWEAGMLFEETTATLFCSDVLHQNGDVEPLTSTDIVGRAQATITEMQAGPLANYLPYTPRTDGELQRIADLKPKTVASMHGSVFVGDGERLIRDYAVMLRETIGS